MTDHYAKWRKRLEIAELFDTVAARRDALKAAGVMTYTQPELDDCGFYRLPLTEPAISKVTGQRNGRQAVIGYEPVWYYPDDGTLYCSRNGFDVSSNEATDIWTHAVSNPISKEKYLAMTDMTETTIETVEPEGWGSAEPHNIPAADREVTAADNATTETIPLVKAHAIAIKTAVDAAIKKVASNEDAATALGTKNRIAELRLAADKDGKAEYEPIYRDYKRIQGEYAASIKLAEGEIKRLNTAILTFRESERKRIAAEQAEADNAQRELDEANARAADRAIARGEPEPEPEVVEVAPIVAAAPLEPTYGSRKLREEIKFILDKVTNWDMLFAHYKNNADVQALLTKLAASDIKAGRTVPGTLSREGLI